MVMILITSPGASKVVFMTTIYATGSYFSTCLNWLGRLGQTYRRYSFVYSIKGAKQFSSGIMMSEGNVSIRKYDTKYLKLISFSGI